MDSSNLFSHPEAPEHIRERAANDSANPVEYPRFSDRPDKDGGAAAT
jgi:hypothetical protein